MVSQETQILLAELRAKARDNTATPDELRQALNLLRGDRTRAQVTSSTSKTKVAAGKAKANVNSDDLLSELEGL